jgi:hypothetical protein
MRVISVSSYRVKNFVKSFTEKDFFTNTVSVVTRLTIARIWNFTVNEIPKGNNYYAVRKHMRCE